MENGLIVVVLMVSMMPTVAFAGSTTQMEEAQMGDRWTYTARDEVTGQAKAKYTHTVTDVVGTEISVRVTIPGSMDRYVTYDRDWNVKSDAVWRYSPNDGLGVKQPVSMGERWNRAVRQTPLTGTGASWNCAREVKVVGEETLTTPAGTFETFQIENGGKYQSISDPTRKTENIVRTWYAPAINHWVKRTSEARSNGHLLSKMTEELVEYGRRE